MSGGRWRDEAVRLGRQVTELTARVAELEDELGPPPILEEGWHDAVISDVTKKVSLRGRIYWSVEYRVGRRKAWQSLPERRPSPVEELGRSLGTTIRPTCADKEIDWGSHGPEQLTGSECRIKIRHETYSRRSPAFGGPDGGHTLATVVEVVRR